MKKRKIKKLSIISIILILIIIIIILYELNIIPHKKYTNAHFGITPYVSNIDRDEDGIDDQTDILKNAKEYVSKKPKYMSKYYATGYPDDEYGVCTDVVAFALLGAGYDLKELVNEDIIKHNDWYQIEVIDKNIDFRRVLNLDMYFKYNSISLTTDIEKIDEWQGGDIVVFKTHIGVISDNRNRKGYPFVIHHAHSHQLNYEEDILSQRKNEIIGHYRIS